MMKLFCVVALSIAALALGCSSSSTPSPSPSGTDGDKTADETGDTDDAGSSGTDTTTVAAPTIDEVAKMMGALHVMWTNEETSCDSVEGERQAAMADGSIMEKYKVVFTVPGDADNKMDSSATEDMKYTYRLRCKKGTTYSDYSNEMSANPTK